MHYPKIMTRINFCCMIISGVLICAIAILSTLEAIVRTTGNTTSWSLDLSCYCMLTAVFLSGGYAFEKKGHIAVDFVIDALEKKIGITARKILVVISYLFAIGFIVFLALGLFESSKLALRLNKYTYATFQIPIVIMYIIMIIGLILMTATIVFIVLDIFTESNEYLDAKTK